jgi:integrase
MRRRSSIVKRGAQWSLKTPLPDGRIRWRTIGPRKADAILARDEANRRIALGSAYVERPSSLAAARAAWLAAYEQRVAPASVAIAKAALRHLEPLDERTVETIRASELEQLVTALARTRPRMAQLVLRFTKAILRTARERGQVVDPAVFQIKPPRHVARVPRALTWDEVETLASWMPDNLARIVPVAAGTGLRQSELLRLRTADVDLARATLRVRKSKTSAGVRTVDVPAFVVTLLREQIMARPAGTDLVFASPLGFELDGRRFMGRYFRPAAIRAGLEHVTFHDLRHCYVSMMAAAGVHVSVIAASVGHADGGALLLRRYTHLFAGSQATAAATLDAFVRGGVAGG